MSSRTLLNLALFTAILGLMLVTLYEPGIEGAPEPKRLTAAEPSAVQRLRMERPDRPSIRFEKQAGVWKMLEPYQLPANSYRIGSLLDIVKTTSHSQLPAADLELERFSLAPANASLFVDELRIDFGGNEQINALRYVRVEDNVHLISDLYYHHMLTPAASLVDHGLLGRDAVPVEIVLPKHRLLRDEERWSVIPDSEDISADSIVQLVDAWRHAQAIEVKPADTGQGDSTVSVRLNGQDEPIRFHVSAREHAIVFARPDAGVQYHLTESSAEPLLVLDMQTTDPESVPQDRTEQAVGEQRPPAEHNPSDRTP